jgi:hypothetical protein
MLWYLFQSNKKHHGFWRIGSEHPPKTTKTRESRAPPREVPRRHHWRDWSYGPGADPFSETQGPRDPVSWGIEESVEESVDESVELGLYPQLLWDISNLSIRSQLHYNM